MSDKPITINKVGGAVRKTIKNTKTFPKGVLKRKTARVITGVRDPAASPPFKKGIRILTSEGEIQKRKSIQKTLRNMPEKVMRERLKAAKMDVGSKAPPALVKLILESGAEAGMVSLR
jgi:hypothetical protein